MQEISELRIEAFISNAMSRAESLYALLWHVSLLGFCCLYPFYTCALLLKLFLVKHLAPFFFRGMFWVLSCPLSGCRSFIL